MSMNIEIYTSVNCFYCVAAKRLLDEKNIRYVEHDVSRDITLREKMLEKANGLRTVPQIFINDVHIGGCDELYEMRQDFKVWVPLLPNPTREYMITTKGDKEWYYKELQKCYNCFFFLYDSFAN